MRKILITGANSYVGTNVEKWLMKETDKYYVETIDMKNPNWKEYDFSRFDVVFHVAGIAHVSTKKNMKDLYFKVNRDLAIETAIKAKVSGVKLFIFMSSMIVYNSKESRITLETKPKPDNFYGLSKFQAENGILQLQSELFRVAILRPPMIYGTASKGNFAKLLKFSKSTLVFPNIKNTRSILYIDNLCKYIIKYIETDSDGILFPQNKEYFTTSEVVKLIRQVENKRVLLTKLFNWVFLALKKKNNIINKIFGSFYYDIENKVEIDLISLKESIFIILKGQV